MSQKLFDVTVELSDKIPLWPGSPGMNLRWLRRIDENNPANVSELTIEMHTATHIDAPLHFIENGKTVEQLDLDILLGEAQVIYLPGIKEITSKDLENANIDSSIKRLLIKTDNSRYWENKDYNFHKDFVALTADAAEWIVAQNIKLVGIDYLSIQLFNDSPKTHQILLGADVIIIETLDLSKVEPGKYELLCLPLKIKGAEAAPARVLLKRLEK